MTTEDVEKIKRFIPAELASSARLDIWIEMASYRCSQDYFKSSWHLAMAYMASHIGTLESRGAGDEVGSLTSKSEGSISVSYSPAGGGQNDDLLQTIYGRYYLDMLNAKRPGPFLSGSGF